MATYREVIEQREMRRSTSFTAEVKHGGDERLAEVPRPDVVDGDARRERMTLVGQPLGEGAAAASAGGREPEGPHTEGSRGAEVWVARS